MDKIVFSKRIKDLRNDLKLTQKDLGEKVNVTKVSICGYENGTRTPNIETLEDLANVFGVKVDYLMGNDDLVVAEKDKSYHVHLPKEALTFIGLIKQNEQIYKQLIEDPKRFAELVIKKLG